MSKNYLDLNGLTTYHNNITDLIDEQNEIIELTNVEYQALSTAEKNNGKYYHITDRAGTFSMDNKVTQTALDDSNNVNYELLLSGTADHTTRTEGANKHSCLKFNPYHQALTFGARSGTVGDCSAVLGYYCVASGGSSIAEGTNTEAGGDHSHAEGYGTVAQGQMSHSEGWYTEANSDCQHVQGKYNIVDNQDTYAYIIGNGTANNARSNALTVDWSGNLVLAGNATVNSDVVLNGTNQTWDGTNTSLKTAISGLNSNLTDLIKFKDYSCSYSVTANGSTAITANDLSVSTPSGYTPLGFYLIATGNANVIARNIYSRSTGSNTMVQVKNTSTSALSNLTLEISIAYIKSNFVGS